MIGFQLTELSNKCFNIKKDVQNKKLDYDYQREI